MKLNTLREKLFPGLEISTSSSARIAGRLSAIALSASLAATSPVRAQAAQPYTIHVSAAERAMGSQLAAARSSYYAALEGNSGASETAREQFSHLLAEDPHNATFRTYQGSLDLLDSARTWAFWRKRELSQRGLAEMDAAVASAPDDLEARFVRALTTWHLPFFFHRRPQAEADLLILGPRAEAAARSGQLPPPLAAAALDYWGQVLDSRRQTQQAHHAYQAAVRVAPASPGGKDAAKRLQS